MNPARMFMESLDRRPGIREQPGSISRRLQFNHPADGVEKLPRNCQAYRQRLDRMQHSVHHSGLANSSGRGWYSG